jgi:hypothetical protein
MTTTLIITLAERPSTNWPVVLVLGEGGMPVARMCSLMSLLVVITTGPFSSAKSRLSMANPVYTILTRWQAVGGPFLSPHCKLEAEISKEILLVGPSEAIPETGG